MEILHTKQLQDFGLSAKEATVYETLLLVGKATASELANQTKLNRSTTYVQLRSLLNLGLVTSFKVDKKTLFAAESPENLRVLLNKRITDLERQKNQINELLPDLAKVFTSHSVTPVIRHFQGKNGLIAMRNEVFASDDAKIRMVMDYNDLERVFTREELHAYSEKRKEQTIQSYTIYRLDSGPDLAPFHYQHLKRIKNTTALFGCDMYIYGNTVSFAAMKSEIVGVSIDQANIADAMKGLFDTYWDFHPAVN